MSINILEFEKPIAEVAEKIEALQLAASDNPELLPQIDKLKSEQATLTKKIYSKLSTWQKVQVARHPNRPHTLDFIERIFDEFEELHGDRQFADDASLVGGIAKLEGMPVMIIGHEKGRSTEEKILHNFGMSQPEGYRKACRLMQLAERFSLPVVTLVDTPGAYPGIDSEERGQSEAIAYNLRIMSSLKTPIIVNVVGEGGSGGALALGVGDHITMLEHSTYSVASPEACASIVWRDSTKADLAAEAMKLNAESILDLGLIDEVIPEPLGGAHRSFDQAASNLSKVLIKSLDQLTKTPINTLVEKRYERLMSYGSI